MSAVRTIGEYAFLAFLVFFFFYSPTPDSRADTLSYPIPGILGDWDSSIEITSDATPSWRAIWDEKIGNDFLGRPQFTSYYRYSPLLGEFIHGKEHLRLITRVGLSPVVGGSLFTGVNLAERWPLLIAIAVIISVLLYMELLIRRHRSLKAKPVQPGRVPHFSSTLRSGATEFSRDSKNV